MKSTIDWKLGLWWSLATLGGLVLGLVILFAGLGAAINNAPPFLFGPSIWLAYLAMEVACLARLLKDWDMVQYLVACSDSSNGWFCVVRLLRECFLKGQVRWENG